jgi:hypothetical protein
LNKKGGVNAIFFVAVIVILLMIWGLMSLIGNYALKEVTEDFVNDPDVDSYAAANLEATNEGYPKTMDSSYLVILIIAWLGVIIASMNALEHPIFFVVAIIFVACLLFVGATLSNFYEEIASQDELVESAADFPVSYFVNQRMVLVVLAIIATVIVTMYARERL